VGELASGLFGEGRMEEPEVIFEVIRSHFLTINDLDGRRILISAGPTYEPIDPVRFIGNYSSGKMGFELAREASNLGAKVILVTGPVDLDLSHANVEVIRVKTASQMAKACLEAFPECELTIMAAAVADYTIENPASQKIKKTGDGLSLQLTKTMDILAEMGKMKRPGQFLTGFALETENESFNALEKLQHKNLDLIVLNSLNDKGAGFGTDTNKVTLIFRDGKQLSLPLASKAEVARQIFNAILPWV
jgi:phosphopantothenoylcysteine decarboxylase/phosphopantothenate--cysteine ligase